MKKSVIKFFDKIIVLLLGSSGILYSCYKYGMLVAEYEINGIVTDKSNAQSIPNIRVIRQLSDENYGDTVFTNSEGQYNLKFRDYKTIHLIFEDIDGEENGGEFKTKEIDLKMPNNEENVEKVVITQNVELEKETD